LAGAAIVFLRIKNQESANAMIRPLGIEFVMFVAPFLAYALFLWAKNAGVLDLDQWPLRVVIWLTSTAIVLVAVSLVLLAHFSGARPGSTYIPAHLENGVLVPGETR
jgi:hypothetical protein